MVSFPALGKTPLIQRQHLTEIPETDYDCIVTLMHDWTSGIPGVLHIAESIINIGKLCSSLLLHCHGILYCWEEHSFAVIIAPHGYH